MTTVGAAAAAVVAEAFDELRHARDALGRFASMPGVSPQAVTSRAAIEKAVDEGWLRRVVTPGGRRGPGVKGGSGSAAVAASHSVVTGERGGDGSLLRREVPDRLVPDDVEWVKPKGETYSVARRKRRAQEATTTGELAAGVARRVLEARPGGAQAAPRRAGPPSDASVNYSQMGTGVARAPLRPKGPPPAQRGRTGAAQGAWNAGKHPRGAGGRFTTSGAQQQLQRHGLYKGKVDGQAGPQTQQAIREFQRRYGLPVTGQLDERTQLTLQHPPPLTAGQVARQEAQQATSPSTRKSGLNTADPKAVKAFQQEQGIKADGVVGPQTREAMRRAGVQPKASSGSGGGSSRGGSSRSGGGSSRSGGGARSGGRSGLARSTATRLSGVLRQGVGMNLKRGNGDVKQLQTALQDLGYDVGKAGVDGKFGPDTEKAVKAFQREHGLTPDGVIGRHTRRLLDLMKSRSASAKGKQQAPLSIDQVPLSEAGLVAAAAAEQVLETAMVPGARRCTAAERQQLWQRFPFVAPRDGADGGAVSLKRDKDGVFVHTHRARSKSYPSVATIPESAVRYIESTG
jgi:peptidoglycan hydrolase-like protein with peptidoglycan-binding domain